MGTGGLLMHVVTTTVLLVGRHLGRVRWIIATTGLVLAMIVNGVVPAVWVGVGRFCHRSSSARWSGYPPLSIDAVDQEQAAPASTRNSPPHFSECQVVEMSGIVIKMNVWTWLEPAQEPTPAPDDK